MFSASQARSTAESNAKRLVNEEISSYIRHRVQLGEFCCYFEPSKEQQVRDVLAGKGYTVIMVNIPKNKYDPYCGDRDKTFITCVKVSW